MNQQRPSDFRLLTEAFSLRSKWKNTAFCLVWATLFLFLLPSAFRSAPYEWIPVHMLCAIAMDMIATGLIMFFVFLALTSRR